MNRIHYVLLVALDPDTGHTVGITKLKGPAFLLNRVTFPGGKIEEGESVHAAACREMREETGIHIPAEQWQLYEVVRTDEYVLNKCVAVTSKVLHARQQEEEPVWHLAIEHHLGYAAKQPAQYVPDFIPTLQGALAAAGLSEVAVST